MEITDIEKHINELIETQKNYHVNDPRVYDLWDKMTDILTQDIYKTITYFQNISQDKLSWVSQVFPEIMEKTNSKDFLYFLKSLVQKYPESDFRLISETAISYYIEQ